MNIKKGCLYLFLLTGLSACTNGLVQTNGRVSLNPLTTANESYQQQIIADANLAANTQQWVKALSLLQEALSKTPDSTILQQALSNLRQRQAEQLTKLEKERLIAQGEWAIKDLAIRQLTDNSSSDNWLSAITPLTAIHYQNEKLANELAELGKHSLDHGNLDDAARAISLALILSPSSSDIKTLNGNLQIKINSQKQQELPPVTSKTSESISETEKTIIDLIGSKSKTSVNTKSIDKTLNRSTSDAHDPSEHYKHLLIEFKKAIKQGQIIEARNLLEKLQKLEVDKITLADLSQQIDQHISGRVKNLIDTGVSLYSQQHYNEALNAWRQAQVLDPSNTLLAAHIGRVNKVLEKLHNLREKQGKAPRK